MADTDQFIIKCHAAPKVFIDGSDDAAGKFTLHEDTGNKSGTITIKGTEASGTARWYYDSGRQIGTADTDIFHTGKTYTDGTAIDLTADIVMGIYIRHKGVDENGDTMNQNVIWFSDGDGGNSSVSEQMLKPGEATATRCHTANGGGQDNCLLSNFEAETITGDDAMIEVLAFVDDVSG